MELQLEPEIKNRNSIRKHKYRKQTRSQNSIKMEMKNEEKSVQNCSKNRRKYEKIQPWRCLGALWGPSWRQDGARAATRAKLNRKCKILGSPRGAKMEPKSMKILMKKRMIFQSDFETTFFRSWYEFGTKNLCKIEPLRVIFQPCCRYAKSVILNNPPTFLLYFQGLRRWIFDFKS